MNEWLKLVQCRQTPTEIFTIFDYTKIAYLIDSGLCIREIVTTDEKPAFIPISHQFQTIYKLFWAKDGLISVQKANENHTINFYYLDKEEQTFKIYWQAESIASVHTVQSEDLLMIAGVSTGQQTTEIIFFDCVRKSLIAKGLFQGEIDQAVVGPNNSISILHKNHITAYKNQYVEQGVGRVYRDREYIHNQSHPTHHFWVDGQLLVCDEKSIQVIIDQKPCQSIKDFHRIHMVAPLICGYLVCDSCIIKIFKKVNGEYQLICELNQQFLMESSNLCISPQEDILAFYSKLTSEIIYSTSINDQIEETSSSTNLFAGNNVYLKSQVISHQKSFDFCLFCSQQPMFAASNSSEIQLYSSNQYYPFMNLKLSEQNKQTNVIDAGVKIRTVAVHPNRPIVAVALRKQIKLYYVTFNETRILKQFQVSMCGGMVFSHSGAMLSTIVAGKNGAKISIFRVNEQKNQYYLMETMNVPKKILKMYWNTIDTKFYCVYGQGYYQWSLASNFKQKDQYHDIAKFSIIGSLQSERVEDNKRQQLMIMWGDHDAILLKNNTVEQEINLKKKERIKNIFYAQNLYIFVLQSGVVCKSKNFDLVLNSQYDLKTHGQDFDIQLQQNNRLIYMSHKCNIKFFQFGKKNEDFCEVIGIQKRRIMNILEKHKKYEQTIRSLRESFTNTVFELKAEMNEEKKAREETFKEQLQSHVERYNSMREEKAKLEEIMESNLSSKEKEAMVQVKQLEKLYQRKIAITTNKLLTEKEIGYRDKEISENNLKKLEEKHYESIEQIRKEYGIYVKNNMSEKEAAHKKLMELKKNYQCKIYDLEQENEALLEHFQNKNDDSLQNLRKLVNEWENKYSECISMKDNVENSVKEKIIENQILNQKIVYLQKRKQEVERRCEHLSGEINQIVKTVEEKNHNIKIYEKRIQDLEKSNEILKYRVLQLKEQNGPCLNQIDQLKTNMTDLDEEYDKLLQESEEKQYKIQVLKKQKNKFKEQNEVLISKQKKIYKRYDELIDRIRQVTKSPIQQVRKSLILILEEYSKSENTGLATHKRSDSPLGELNRMRDHLQICLESAVNSNKRSEQQKILEIKKKSHQNSELLKQINNLRIKLKSYEKTLKQKETYINRLLRGEATSQNSNNNINSYTNADSFHRYGKQLQKLTVNDRQTNSNVKSHTRQTAYEKSMFKSSFWRQKRLKTEQGSRKKKSSYSMIRDKTQHQLAIAPINQEIEEYKRIIEQKDRFIEKLLNRIQNP